MKKTFKKAGYTYIMYLGDKQHLLRNLDTGTNEVWFSNKNHAGYGLIYKNTYLEFAHSE